MSGRTTEILRRFPAHMSAADGGKQLGVVVAALAENLESVVADLAAVRRSHRLAHADTLRDLLALGALHGISSAELRVLFMRAEHEALSFRATVAALRARIGAVSAIHASGNGTNAALLRAASNALDLDADEAANRALLTQLELANVSTLDYSIQDPFFHSSDRFVHSTLVRDRLIPKDDAAEPEIVGLIENPLRRELASIGPVVHAQRFSVTRRGFGARELRIECKGVADHTFGPMLVNRDKGSGIGFAGNVPDGQTLVFDEADHATLSSATTLADVTEFAYTFTGACFADAAEPHRFDFVFDGTDVEDTRRARFVVTRPANALDREAVFPHAETELAGPTVSVGVTRFAFFVQVAHLGARELPATPRSMIAFADGSVFAATPSETPPTAAELAVSWLEHEAYSVRVLIPKRFADLDDDEPHVTEHVRTALERFRPAGVKLEVAYLDDRWTLGEGVITGQTGDPNARLLGGTTLWPQPTNDPGPDA